MFEMNFPTPVGDDIRIIYFFHRSETKHPFKSCGSGLKEKVMSFTKRKAPPEILEDWSSFLRGGWLLFIAWEGIDEASDLIRTLAFLLLLTERGFRPNDE